ncbi:MAG: type II 3-dehydroquinate dehydratase [Clostridia bacterium]|nr:type II 3-dehydroquinate dehydratase [Clostridia bacterium]
MKVLVINGVNLNMLGIREPLLYGDKSYAALVKGIKAEAKALGLKVRCLQSNEEGKIVTYIQRALGKYDAIVINPGAYTHTSVAILDALKAVAIPTYEVHLTDVDAREDFRKVSYVSLVAKRRITGLGFEGYYKALRMIAGKEDSPAEEV